MEQPVIYRLDGSDEEVDEGVLCQSLSVEQELNRFRREWQQELRVHKSSIDESPREECEEPSTEEQAKFLFLQGVNAEEGGRFYEAIQFYRRAVQLVPDIEFKIGDYKERHSSKKKKERTISECSVDSSGLGEHEDPDDLCNLLTYFQKLKVGENGYCSQKTTSSHTHISMLPVEVLQYIFKWVVSAELDVVALEYLSLVSRGFYICARDEQLWRLICQRVWGRSCGDATNYGSYRDMYYTRPHLRFTGCYISKISYYREGEKNVSEFYKPFHLVEYFRYARFFPEGYMYLWTSPNDPMQCLQKLKTKYSNEQGLLYGYYKLAGNLVTAVLKWMKVEKKTAYERFRRKNRNTEANSTKTCFHVEFELRNSGSRHNSLLQWRRFTTVTIDKGTGEKTCSEFELSSKSYPPLIFSRVKSYTNCCDKMLG